MQRQLDVESILADLGVPNPSTGNVYTEGQLTFDDGAVADLAMNNTAWLAKVDGQRHQMTDVRALNVAREVAGAKRRTLQWLDALGYQGVLALWRRDTKGLVAVVDRFEFETGEEFDPALIMDYMESHDTWSIDLEDIWRTHAYLHEARWQTVVEEADTMNMVSVARAKQMSQLMFERAGTLNREKLAKTAPQAELNSGSVVNVIISKDGVNQVGTNNSQTAQRQQLTAKARVRYGTSNYIDPPGLKEWQQGLIEIPDDKVDDYLMLTWLPTEFNDVVPEAATAGADPGQGDEKPAVDSPVQYDPATHSLITRGSK